MNGSTESDREGRVEVCVDGRWGTVQAMQPRELAEAVCRNDYRGLESFTTSVGEKRQLLIPCHAY